MRIWGRKGGTHFISNRILRAALWKQCDHWSPLGDIYQVVWNELAAHCTDCDRYTAQGYDCPSCLYNTGCRIHLPSLSCGVSLARKGICLKLEVMPRACWHPKLWLVFLSVFSRVMLILKWNSWEKRCVCAEHTCLIALTVVKNKNSQFQKPNPPS